MDRGVSGAKGRAQRPQFDKLCQAATRREFDLIMSWSVDRLGRIQSLGERCCDLAQASQESSMFPENLYATARRDLDLFLALRLHLLVRLISVGVSRNSVA